MTVTGSPKEKSNPGRKWVIAVVALIIFLTFLFESFFGGLTHYSPLLLPLSLLGGILKPLPYPILWIALTGLVLLEAMFLSKFYDICKSSLSKTSAITIFAILLTILIFPSIPVGSQGEYSEEYQIEADFQKGCSILKDPYNCEPEMIHNITFHSEAFDKEENFLEVCRYYFKNPAKSSKECVNSCPQCTNITQTEE